VQEVFCLWISFKNLISQQEIFRIRAMITRGEDLKTLRKNRFRLSQVQFGKIMGVTPFTVSNWETERAEIPHYVGLMTQCMADDPRLQRKIEEMVGL